MSPEDELMTDRALQGPLTGLVVADFSRILAGPYATMLLADMGATVIKVESPAGDDTRTWMPPVHRGEATYYLSINRNKKSIVLDLKDPTDLHRAHSLVQRADIMIENFKPGQLVQFNLDYDAVRQLNPGLIVASISGFGSQEPGAKMMGYDLMIQAMSGLMSLTGEADGPPFRSGISVFDILAGMHCTTGILAALYERASSGRGQHVEVSLMASALSGLANHSNSYAMEGVVPYRMGNAHPSLFPYEPFPTGDGELVVIAGNDGQFKALVTALGRPDLAFDPDFVTNKDRTRNRDKLRPILVELLATKSATAWFETLTAAKVPCAPIVTVDAGVTLADQLGLAPIVTLPYRGEELRMIRHPITFSETPVTYRMAPPTIGEHTDELRAWLDSEQPVSHPSTTKESE
jgi:crotonobetainyl-CoA:carnitine CoA-transferase CaiB-like acyl-CoA transferase